MHIYIYTHVICIMYMYICRCNAYVICKTGPIPAKPAKTAPLRQKAAARAEPMALPMLQRSWAKIKQADRQLIVASVVIIQ